MSETDRLEATLEMFSVT